jgi:competence protein ComEA
MLRVLTLFLAGLLCSLTAFAEVDVNQAAAGDLVELPGIGPVKAAAIISYRTDHGPFKSLAELDQVPGIGPATLLNITPHVTFSGSVAAAVVGVDLTQATPAVGININAAGAGQLQELPGIGPSKADAIIADRTANGPFASCDDLQRVKGVGPATVDAISTLCTTQ